MATTKTGSPGWPGPCCSSQGVPPPLRLISLLHPGALGYPNICILFFPTNGLGVALGKHQGPQSQTEHKTKRHTGTKGGRHPPQDEKGHPTVQCRTSACPTERAARGNEQQGKLGNGQRARAKPSHKDQPRNLPPNPRQRNHPLSRLSKSSVK